MEVGVGGGIGGGGDVMVKEGGEDGGHRCRVDGNGGSCPVLSCPVLS
jgi:hypothetical protein